VKTSRRKFLRYGLGLTAATAFPSIWTRKSVTGYSNGDIEQRLSIGRGLEGLTKNDLATPTLVLDLDVFESNLEKMSRHAKEVSIELRPHAKTHKCIEVARRQIDAGALGVCTATISEAEALAEGGINGLLITSEMVGRDKIRRLVQMTRNHPDTMSVIDHPDHAKQLSQAAVEASLELNVLVDIDPIGRRTGVSAGKPAIDLAHYAEKLPNLKLRGIHSYSGPSSHVTGFEERRAHSRRVMAAPIETFFKLQEEGLPMEILSGGSTGTYNIDPEFEGMTELQVGSYVFMDVDYRIIGGKSGPDYDDFGQSLKVIATVISKNHDDRATIDAGFKAFATDRDFGPDIIGISGITYRFGGDEHGILQLDDPSREVKLGDRLEFVVPHCDPNVNLYDRIYCLRGEKVEEIWPVVGKYV